MMHSCPYMAFEVLAKSSVDMTHAARLIWSAFHMSYQAGWFTTNACKTSLRVSRQLLIKLVDL